MRYLLLTLVLLLVPASLAHAESINQFVFDCHAPNYSNVKVDPMVHPGVSPTDHAHTQGGAKVFTPSESYADMLAAPGTSCPLSTDRTSFWAPTPKDSTGAVVPISDMQYWVSNQLGLTLPTTAAGVAATFDKPASQNGGLRWVQGDHDCSIESCGTTTYICVGSNPTVQYNTVPTVVQCPQNQGYLMVQYATNPHCWDGVSQGQGMGGSSPANVIGVNITDPNLMPVSCPSTNPIPVPGAAVVLKVPAQGLGGYISSDEANAGLPDGSTTAQIKAAGVDPGSSGHADWIEGLTPTDMALIDQYCLDPQYGSSQNVLTTCLYKASGTHGPGLYATNGVAGQFPTFVTAS